MEENSVLEPLDAYSKKYKNEHLKNVTEYFAELTEKSGVDIKANADTVKKYKEKRLKLKYFSRKLLAYKLLNAFAIVFCVLLGLCMGLFLYTGIKHSDGESFVSFAISLLFFVTILLTVLLKFRPLLKDPEKAKAELQTEADDLKAKAWRQMEKLNSLYDWNVCAELFTKTVPMIKTDKTFDTRKAELLRERYGFEEDTDGSVSVEYVQSGSINGNPFLIIRERVQDFEDREYRGEMDIEWEVRTSKGLLKKRQTLKAGAVKPVPVYYSNTYLVYANEAAPSLSFTRKPSKFNGLPPKLYKKAVKSEIKRLQTKSREAVERQNGYTMLGNAEFEVLFGAEDRNNETQFRLLFTPLAQKNEVKLIKSKSYYGDDYKLIKDGCINYVRSEHSQELKLSVDPKIFEHFDYARAKKFFIEYNQEYFKSVYFDFAPLLSIPLYQQHKSREYIYKNSSPSNYTTYEHESLANAYPQDILLHSKSATECVLKTEFIERNGNADTVKIIANSFATQEKTELVKVQGGDKRFHEVPVKWIDYVPVKKSTYMEVKEYPVTRAVFEEKRRRSDFAEFEEEYAIKDCFNYERGMISFLLKRSYDGEADRKLSHLTRLGKREDL